MITVKEIITVDRDDPRLKDVEEHFVKYMGWKKEEREDSVTYTRNTLVGRWLEDDETD